MSCVSAKKRFSSQNDTNVVVFEKQGRRHHFVHHRLQKLEGSVPHFWRLFKTRKRCCSSEESQGTRLVCRYLLVVIMITSLRRFLPLKGNEKISWPFCCETTSSFIQKTDTVCLSKKTQVSLIRKCKEMVKLRKIKYRSLWGEEWKISWNACWSENVVFSWESIRWWMSLLLLFESLLFCSPNALLMLLLCFRKQTAKNLNADTVSSAMMTIMSLTASSFTCFHFRWRCSCWLWWWSASSKISFIPSLDSVFSWHNTCPFSMKESIVLEAMRVLAWKKCIH